MIAFTSGLFASAKQAPLINFFTAEVLLKSTTWLFTRFMSELIETCSAVHDATRLLVSYQAFYISPYYPAAGLSAPHVREDWLLDWSLEAQLLITYLSAAYPKHRRSIVTNQVKRSAEEAKLGDDLSDESCDDGADVKPDLQLDGPSAGRRVLEGRFGRVGQVQSEGGRSVGVVGVVLGSFGIASASLESNPGPSG